MPRGVSLGFCPDIALSRSLCGVGSEPILVAGSGTAKAINFLPGPTHAPWLALVVSRSERRSFASVVSARISSHRQATLNPDQAKLRGAPGMPVPSPVRPLIRERSSEEEISPERW